MEHGVVIVGASIAGVNLVKQLRKKGYEGKITLIDKHKEFPYDLMQLSKDWLLDKETFSPPLLQKETFYDDQHVQLRLDTEIVHFNSTEKTLQTATDEIIHYDKLVIAIGSVLRKMNAPNVDAKGIFYLRDFKSALQLKEWGQDAKKLVIVGAGFIGLELASTFRQLGLDVTVLERGAHPLERIVGSDVSQYFTEMHQSHGVKLLTNEEVKSFSKDEHGNIQSVLTVSGKVIPCDMVVIGIGVVPNTSLSHDDLKIERGIVVNEYGETSIPDVYAAGDCTVWPYQNKLIHVEHWEHAYNHGQVIAKNLIEKDSTPYTVRPYFWTDEYDQTFEYLGHATEWHKTIIRGSTKERQFTVAYVDEQNYPIAILFANEGDKRKEVSAFMDQSKPIDEDKFTDLSIRLNEM